MSHQWKRVVVTGLGLVALVGQAQSACGVPVGAFCVDYFAGQALSGAVLASANVPVIDHNWGNGAPMAGVPADNFSGRWQGSFNFPAGTYKFSATADDGVRVLIDGVPIIDAYVLQAATTFEKLYWLSGQHRVTVEYFEGWGGARLKAGWTLVRADGEPAPAPIGSNARSPLGSNLSDWPDWSVEQPFLDLFKTSRAWIPQAPGVWDTGERAKLDLDANGWVRSLPAASATSATYRSVATLLLNGADLNTSRPGGEYVVRYDGEGTITYAAGARKVVAKSQPGRDVVQVDPTNSSGLQINLTATDPNGTGNYLRNLRVVAPGVVCDDAPLQMCLADNDPACQRAACRSTESAVLAGRLFHPQFLRSQVRYKALRFMAPMSANVIDSRQPQITDWSQRNTLGSARWNGQAGAPPEVVLALSNQLQADPWVNMPHRASDDYIRQYARQARAQLAPDRKVYVEYGNEVWNTAFSAGGWVQQQGEASWPGSPDSGYTKRINWYGVRTAQTCDLWKAEWGIDAGRVVCVLGAQAANPWTATAALDCRLWTQQPCQAHGIGAVAIAPYFGSYLGQPTYQSQLQAWAADADGGLGRLFAEVNAGGVLTGGPAGGALAEARRWMAAHAIEASRRGLLLLAYEGGQHLAGVGNVANDNAITTLFVTANRDARMKSVYLTTLNDWFQASGGLFMHFQGVGAASRWGSWGALETMGQTSSAKFDALGLFIDGNLR